MIITDTMECLTRVEVNEKGESIIKPAAAESWKVSDDKLVYTFTIRKGMTWKDGKPLTAKNFEYSLLRTLNKDTGSSYAAFLYSIKNAVPYNKGTVKAEEVGIKAKDDYTLEITLERPTAYFMQMSYFALLAPQREDIVKQYGEQYESEADKYISCGPFKVAEWIRDSKIVLVKNDNYYDKDSVNLQKVNIHVIKERDARMQEFYTGNLDIVEAVDRGQVEDLIYQGTVGKATGIVPPMVDLDGKEYRGLANYEPVNEILKETPYPKKLLVEGLKELNMDEDPSKITVEYLVRGTTAVAKKNAEVFQQMF